MRKSMMMAFAALAAFSMPAFIAPAFAATVAKPVEWKIGKDVFSGYAVYDDATTRKRPGLLMVPDWFGVTDATVDKAKQQAGSDYVVLIVDMYGKGIRPKNADEALAQVQKLYPNPDAMRERAAKALDVLKAQPNVDASKLGAFGYCFGGSTVLELARSGVQLAGIVTFHGGLATAKPAEKGAIKTPLLVLNGAADPNVKRADIEKFWDEMDNAGADWQFVNFSGAVHCFALETANSPPGCMYNERAARRAYMMMHAFFKGRFAVE